MNVAQYQGIGERESLRSRGLRSGCIVNFWSPKLQINALHYSNIIHHVRYLSYVGSRQAHHLFYDQLHGQIGFLFEEQLKLKPFYLF